MKCPLAHVTKILAEEQLKGDFSLHIVLDSVMSTVITRKMRGPNVQW